MINRTGHNNFIALRIDSIKRSFEPYWWALGMEAEMAEYFKELSNDS